MAKNKHQRTVQENNKELYVVEVIDWEMSFGHRIYDENMKQCPPVDFFESQILTLLGKITRPTLKNVSQAKIDIIGSPILEDQVKNDALKYLLQEIGYINFIEADNTLRITCSVPFRSIPYLSVAAAAGKIKRASIWGTKLKWGQGWMSRIALETGSTSKGQR